jgi:hypothetical protein
MHPQQPYSQQPYQQYPQQHPWPSAPGGPATRSYPQPTAQQPWPPLPPGPARNGFADYPTNTILTNESADLGDIVQDDLFKAEVVVAGSLSYETSLGGSTTVPKLTVTKISVIGSAK